LIGAFFIGPVANASGNTTALSHAYLPPLIWQVCRLAGLIGQNAAGLLAARTRQTIQQDRIQVSAVPEQLDWQGLVGRQVLQLATRQQIAHVHLGHHTRAQPASTARADLPIWAQTAGSAPAV